MTFNSVSRPAINPIPNTTALVVPLVVPSGITIDPKSIRESGLPIVSLVFRSSSVIA